MRFPIDLMQFLEQGKQLEYAIEACDAGRVELVSAAGLTLSTVYFSGVEVSDLEADPNEGLAGHYVGECINLIYDCDNFDPSFLLCWYPSLNLYGSYNEDNETGIVFPNTDWARIVSDPVRYLNASWLDDTMLAEMGHFAVPILPWHYFPYEV